jgi:hypothetical protein
MGRLFNLQDLLHLLQKNQRLLDQGSLLVWLTYIVLAGGSLLIAGGAPDS